MTAFLCAEIFGTSARYIALEIGARASFVLRNIKVTVLLPIRKEKKCIMQYTYVLKYELLMYLFILLYFWLKR
jgi:hypothetical protein